MIDPEHIIQVCPWMAFPGAAGSKEYAETTAAWLSEEFGETWTAVSTKDGWWYAEEQEETR